MRSVLTSKPKEPAKTVLVKPALREPVPGLLTSFRKSGNKTHFNLSIS